MRTRLIVAALVAALAAACAGEGPCDCYVGQQKNIGPGGAQVTIDACEEMVIQARHYCFCSTSDGVTRDDYEPVCGE